MDIRQMIHRVRALITIALVLSFGLMSFTFVKYESFQKLVEEVPGGCGIIDPPRSESQKASELLPGYQLFKDWGCDTCHSIDRKVVGPALDNVRGRRTDKWLISFIRNSSNLIQSGNEQANELFEEFNRLQMPSHDLTDDEILSILEYITEASETN